MYIASFCTSAVVFAMESVIQLIQVVLSFLGYGCDIEENCLD